MSSKTRTRRRRRPNPSQVELEGLFAQGKLSKESIDAIASKIALGMPVRIAVQFANISEKTFYNWMDEGMGVAQRVMNATNAGKDLADELDILSEREALLLQFLQSIKRARSESIERHLVNIQDAGQKSWQASAWFLERQLPEAFGKQKVSASDKPATYDDFDPKPDNDEALLAGYVLEE